MEKTFTYQNAAIFYKVYGTGSPVLLIHGFGEDSSIWDGVVAHLAPHYKVIVPDIPGTGKSQLLQTPYVTIEDYAECLYHLLQQEGITKASIFGHSMGGYILLALLEKHAEFVVTYGFIHSTAFADNEEKKASRKKGIELIEQYGSYSFLKNTTPNLFSEKFKKDNPEKVAGLIEAGNNFSPESLIQYYTAMMNRPDRTAVLEKTQAPVLFILGTEDIAAPLADLEQQVNLPQTSEVHILEGVGHMSMLEAPSELNQHLLSFIKKYS